MDEEMTQCIGLLWSEIPLDKEAYVVARLRREGLYEVWERALDSNMGYVVGTPADWADGGEGDGAE